MRYYIADMHFFHEALNDKMDRRGFSDAGEMNRYMIEQWNSKVKNRDEVVILGDFSLGDGIQTNSIIGQLRGKLFLVQGNHDGRYLNKKEFDPSVFGWIRQYTELSDNNRKVVLCHYPVMCYNGQYRQSRGGKPAAYMLYGHVHDTHDERLMEKFINQTCETKTEGRDGEMRNIPCNMINCFCMYSDYVPLSLDEWIELDSRRKNKTC